MTTAKYTNQQLAALEATAAVKEFLNGQISQTDALSILGHSGVEAVDRLALVNIKLLEQVMGLKRKPYTARMIEHCIAAHAQKQAQEQDQSDLTVGNLFSIFIKMQRDECAAIPDGFFYAGEHETRGPLYLAADKVSGFAVNVEDHGSVIIMLDCGTQVETYLTLEEVSTQSQRLKTMELLAKMGLLSMIILGGFLLYTWATCDCPKCNHE